MSVAAGWKFLKGSVSEVAPRLLGCRLVRRLENGARLSGMIVETEAYDQSDAASHSYKGRTPRTDVMFGPAGRLYVYFAYGMHYCCNVVTGPEGHGSAVLIRAIEPLEGQDIMLENRHGRGGIQLTNGPAKICQALAISKPDNGTDLLAFNSDVRLEMQPPLPADSVVVSKRIGISQAKDVPWRFYIKDSQYASKAFRGAS